MRPKAIYAVERTQYKQPLSMYSGVLKIVQPQELFRKVKTARETKRLGCWLTSIALKASEWLTGRQIPHGLNLT